MIITDKKLTEVYDNWQDKLDADEWYFSNVFESISGNMSSDTAFNYIPEDIYILLELDEDYLIYETLYFLIDLYRIANTSEIHPKLEENWDALRQHIKMYKDSYSTPYQELKRLLRISK
ncbi:MAG: ABC transporter [Bacillaceae bacterium]|nr:ABC transporter [Bacillaceae bacterium]